MIKAQIQVLAAEADLQAAKLEMRRDAIKSLQPQSGAARMRLSEESFEQRKIAAGYRYLLFLIEHPEEAPE
jgi:hypothetical protein